MKKYLVLLVCIFMTQTLSAQEQEEKGKFFKSLYEDLLNACIPEALYSSTRPD